MNYFELFNIPVNFRIDQQLLSSTYFGLQRKYHPDLYGRADEAEQGRALEMSSMVNKGYKTLKDPDATIKYLLQLKGLLAEEEKYQLSPGFLMEVMELNEQVMDGDHSATGSIQSTIDNLKKEIYEPVEAIITNYQEGITSEKELLQVKEYYFSKKYLDRLAEGMRDL